MLPGAVRSRLGQRGAAGGVSPPPAVRLQICRLLFGELLPMPPEQGPQGAELCALEDLARWSGQRVHATLEHLGCLVLAAIAARAELELRQELLAAVGPVHRHRVARALAAPPIPLCRGVRPPPPAAMAAELVVSGLASRALRPTLDGRLARQVAQLLPRRIGILLLEPPAAPGDAEEMLSLLRRADAWSRGGEP